MNTESKVKSKKKIPDDSSNPDADTSPPASVMKSGGVLGHRIFNLGNKYSQTPAFLGLNNKFVQVFLMKGLSIILEDKLSM